MKCKACNYEIENETMSSHTGIKKTISIYYCTRCGTLYIGTTIDGSFPNGIPDGSIVLNDFVYIPVRSNATSKYLEG